MMRAWPLVLLALGCGGTTIATTGYDRACAIDSDCAAVFQGEACAVCICPNAAVNQGQLTRYQSDLAALRTKCGPMPAIACGPCSPVIGLCLGGSCTTRPL